MILCKFCAIFLIFIFTSSFLVRPAVAQDASDQTEKPESTFMNEAHRKEIYDQKKRSQAVAIGYSFLLPGLGNFYAEQYFVGTLLMTSIVFATLFATFGFSTGQSEFYLGAGLLAGGAYIIAPITASFAVRNYNENLRRGLKVSIGYQGKEGVALSLKASF